MTVLATFLTFAALSCKPGVAPFFRLPRPAVTNGEIRTSAIPQRSNATNFVGRLDGHVMSALYGTTEALLERRFFPQLMNYGGARNASAKDLATADFGDGILENLYTTNWFAKTGWTRNYDNYGFPSNFTHAADRDFSNRFTRVAWPIDLANGAVYSEATYVGSFRYETLGWGGLPFFYPLNTVMSSQNDYFYWLVPKRFLPEDPGPTGTWCLNDVNATADWKGFHLLTLQELDCSDLRANYKLWGNQYPNISALIPRWAQDLLYDIGGPDYQRDPYYGFIDLTSRGRDCGIRGRDLFWGFQTNDPPHIATSNATSRFYAERFAFANTALSLCDRTVTFPSTTASWIDATNTTYFPGRQAPRFRFRKRRYSGGHGRGFNLSADNGVKITLSQSGGISAVWDLSKFTKDSFSTTTNWVNAVTSITERVTAGWREHTPLASVASVVNLPCEDELVLHTVEASADVDPNNYKWVFICEYDGWKNSEVLRYKVYLGGTPLDGAPAIEPFVGENPCFYGYIYFRSADVSADIGFHYSSSYEGIEPIGGIRPLRGPTILDSGSVTNEAEWSISPAPRAKFLWDNGIIESVDVNRFKTVGISTNETDMTYILNDWKSIVYDFGKNFDATWAYFKYDEAFKNVKSHEQLLSNYALFHLSFLDDINEIATMNPSQNHRLPTFETARDLPQEWVEDCYKSLLGASVISNRYDSSNLTCSYVGTEPRVYRDGTEWYCDHDAFGFKLSFSWSATTNPVPRESAAYIYEANPVIITNWNFPMMHEDDDGEPSQTK